MDYQIITKNIKSLILRVDKNGIIKVSAPKNYNRKYINDFVESNRQWIEKRINNIPKYNNGSKIYYFENEFLLTIESSFKNEFIELENNLIIKIKNKENIKKMILKWYKQKSKNLIESILQTYQDKIGREVKKVRLRDMSTKWGSCNYSTAVITLNSTLFLKPKICFEYVLLHELIHLVHPNHGKGFYSMLDSLMPHWKEIKNKLEGYLK
ncbi:M48 family metallopeptidase [Helicobacter sp. MIT 14-3879]|uniref:M48 family metallopeptidase n=1 Tax=Helicobacter sp. MIT 14-3879 TaxID=2040649 RepID=UPI000E1F2AC7|nr:SprT family zinc-dependent metalloprotease [Helicobacter sp. MIT 14-3879]RDU60837.1 hypothetical protein CQA44_10165 [Helicobacter sp. MIT 14-3879]